MAVPHITPAPTEMSDEPLTIFYLVGSGLKGTKASELGVTKGRSNSQSSKGVTCLSHAYNDFVVLP